MQSEQEAATHLDPGCPDRHCAARPGAEPGNFHRRPSHPRSIRLRPKLRRMPRHESGRRRIRTAGERHGLHSAMGRQKRPRALHLPQHQDASEQCGRARRSDLSSNHRFHSAIERHPAGREQLFRAPAPNGANGRPRTPAASGPGGGLSPYASLIPGAAQVQSARQTHARHRRAPSKSSGRRMAHLASHLRRPGLQPAQTDQQIERRPVALRLELVALPGRQRSHAAGARRRPVRAQLRRSCPSPGRGDGRPALAVFARNCPNRRLASSIWSSATSPSTATIVLLDTSDLHVVALDMKTGEVAWDHEILDRDQESARDDDRRPARGQRQGHRSEPSARRPAAT